MRISGPTWKPNPPLNTFNPWKSSTLQLAEGKRWTITYGEGDSTKGDVGTDLVDIGGLVIQDQAVELARDLSYHFSLVNFDGILGLGFPAINMVTTTDGEHDPQPTLPVNMINQSDIPKEAELFTSCFYDHLDHRNRKSFFTFGFID